jgi:hypothetical protein
MLWLALALKASIHPTRRARTRPTLLLNDGTHAAQNGPHCVRLVVGVQSAVLHACNTLDVSHATDWILGDALGNLGNQLMVHAFTRSL